ncbi:MAG: hypothetical protein A2Y14_04640 [Verrucomicrobia bacterium GWF2_51_19]|nr:MAG: hypothetical protein A2Y14_04640 [Verrucomicrobia bacterium GWF2_51_19]
MIIERTSYLAKLAYGLEHFPIVSLLGPRQSGKTSLARAFAAKREHVHYFDLEDPRDWNLLSTNLTLLETLQGLVILDEVQRLPMLFPFLRVLADREKPSAQFLLLGSASGALAQNASESLAGRVFLIPVEGFSLNEIDDSQKLWMRGGFPKSFLAEDTQLSNVWRDAFIKTFLEKDLLAFGEKVSLQNVWRFWHMVSHYHGNLLNTSEIGQSMGVDHKTVKNYLDILCDTFMITALKPWFSNVKKRMVKSPKIYIRDSGILHSLLGVDDYNQLIKHPKLGASWEGFALHQILHVFQPRDSYFWRTATGSEIDLLFEHKGKLCGFEFKLNGDPSLTKSMMTALADIPLDSLTIVTPNSKTLALSEKATLVSLADVCARGM